MLPFAESPQRIISLVPSQTELLFDLGLGERIVGITKFCIHPNEWFRTKARIGGTKTVDIDKVKALQPDLIIANKEENVQEQVEALQAICPVYVSDINALQGALDMITEVGKLTNTQQQAKIIAEEIAVRFENLDKSSHHSVAYFIWKNPWMTVGNDTFIHDMIARIGWQNLYAGQVRYPETTLEELVQKKPQLILLSSEPYPFKEKHMEELRTLLPESKILLVDGELFSWYGSRLLEAPGYFRELAEYHNLI